MFLYARIVLDNAKYLADIGELEDGLNILPRDLHEA